MANSYTRTLVKTAAAMSLIPKAAGVLAKRSPWLVRRKADTDAEGTRENLLRIVALKERLPELIVVPVHDVRAFAKIPSVSPVGREGHESGMTNNWL